MESVVIHQSGRFDATGDETRQMLTSHKNRGAKRITMTECGSPKMRSVVANWAKANGWHVWHPTGRGHDESLILSFDKPDIEKSWRLTKLVLRTSRKAPICLTAAHWEGWGWLAVWHAPAHTGGLKPGWPTRVYLSALVGLRLARTKMRGPVTFAADWNLDLANKRWRDLLAKPYPGMDWGWVRGQRPTHGTRVIDGHLTNKTIRQGSVTLHKEPGFDHHGVSTVLKD